MASGCARDDPAGVPRLGVLPTLFTQHQTHDLAANLAEFATVRG